MSANNEAYSKAILGLKTQNELQGMADENLLVANAVLSL
jgi:hypothetical protein